MAAALEACQYAITVLAITFTCLVIHLSASKCQGLGPEAERDIAKMAVALETSRAET